jgi:hypothetical protein
MAVVRFLGRGAHGQGDPGEKGGRGRGESEVRLHRLVSLLFAVRAK